MSKREVKPKTQKEILNNTITPFGNMENPNTEVDGKLNRGKKTSRKNDKDKSFTLGIQDIDEAILYYFDNVLKLNVTQNGTRLVVPTVYASAEKWKAMQKDGYYRDKNGKIMAPLLVFKKNNIERVRGLGNKLDANNPHNYALFQKTFSQRNIYDNFGTLNNRIPQKEMHAVIIPDYINIFYSVTIYTYYVEQMNGIIESINYAADSYWGDPERFQFRTTINNYSPMIELNQDKERLVKNTFDLKLYGHLIPDVINKDINNIGKVYSKTKIVFDLETTGSL